VLLVHYMSLQHNPYNGILPGKCVFSGTRPGIWAVPFIEEGPYSRLKHFWCDGKKRDLQVILNVPEEFVRYSKMGRIQPVPADINTLAGRCTDDDNGAVIIAPFDPSWIVSVKCAYPTKTGYVEEEIPHGFWEDLDYGPPAPPTFGPSFNFKLDIVD